MNGKQLLTPIRTIRTYNHSFIVNKDNDTTPFVSKSDTKRNLWAVLCAVYSRCSANVYIKFIKRIHSY